MEKKKGWGALRAGHHRVAEEAEEQDGEARELAQSVVVGEPVALEVERFEGGAVAQRRDVRRRGHAVVRDVERAQLGERAERGEVDDGIVGKVERAQRGQRRDAGEGGERVFGRVQAAQLRHVVQVLEHADGVALEVEDLEARKGLQGRCS